MATKIVMPQLGESVAEGVVARWLKKPGDRVAKDEPICEIVTDKVSAELPAPAAGVLGAILVEDGGTVNVGAEIGRIDEQADAVVPGPETGVPVVGEAMASGLSQTVSPTPPRAVPVTPPTEREPGTPARYSPAVRRLAEEHAIDLSQVAGTGQGGRVSKEDVLAFLAQRDAAGALAAAASAGKDELVPVSAVRRIIADHMVRSVREAPHATTTFEVDMSRVVKWREAAREQFRQREGVDLTYLPVVVRATAEALKANPLLNSTWSSEGIVVKQEINIGVAVALDDGLIVPVIKQADRKGLADLARAAADLAARARANKLAVSDVQGGTFTVNNPGVFGTLVSAPIINYPQAAILSMEGIAKRAVVIDDAIAIRPMMNVCLSFDHRVMDGLQAARFLQAVKQYLETFDGAKEWS